MRLPFPSLIAPALAVFSVLLMGCGDDSPSSPADPAVTEVRTFLGTMTATASAPQRSVVVDLTLVGDDVTARVSFRPGFHEVSRSVGSFTGRRSGDEIQLSLLSDPQANPPHLTGDLRVDGFSGTFAIPHVGIEGDLDARDLAPAAVVTELETDLSFPESPEGVTYDGEHLWVAMGGRYRLADLEGNAVAIRTVIAPSVNLPFSSSPLAADGGLLWGHLPRTIISPDTTRNISTLIEFDSQGVVASQVELDHQTTALAASGGQLWSIPTSVDRMVRLSRLGESLESRSLEAPDVEDLDYDGTWFWGMGGDTGLLYRMDDQGKVSQVWRLPRVEGFVPLSRGIAWAEGRLWHIGADETGELILQRLRLEEAS